MAEHQELELSKRYHDALLAWQGRNFPDFSLLTQYWDKHFHDEQPFRLSVKLAPLQNELIEAGMFKGQPKLSRAREMKGNMLYSALRIIKAQCSTELGSIQQHLCTLDMSTSERAKFSILRIMAEEFRHAYQMFWVLSHDDTWSTAGIRNLADETMDELLAMDTGTHVLDAFNIPFHDPLDNIVFAFLVDRVGKYQLSMQKIFAYAPMAQSMPPMLKEESFHLRAGHDLLKEVAVAAATNKGAWRLNEIQKRVNGWFPRAIEMFGSPEGGMTNVVFGFKDKLNGESAESYIAEVSRLLRRINVAIVGARKPDLSREKIDRLIDDRVEPDLLHLPDTRFFRLRGPDTVAYQPFDLDGQPVSRSLYLDYLAGKLPASLLQTEFFEKYKSAFAQTSVSSH